ncbi:MAG: hypothetical protein GY757_21870 [bacterium]|nr:hypothetical protein [bacterium]
MTQVQIGAKDNSGLRFTIAVVLADETAHNIFVAFIEKGKTSGDYPEAALPAGVNNLASISVVRK